MAKSLGVAMQATIGERRNTRCEELQQILPTTELFPNKTNVVGFINLHNDGNGSSEATMINKLSVGSHCIYLYASKKYNNDHPPACTSSYSFDLAKGTYNLNRENKSLLSTTVNYGIICVVQQSPRTKTHSNHTKA